MKAHDVLPRASCADASGSLHQYATGKDDEAQNQDPEGVGGDERNAYECAEDRQYGEDHGDDEDDLTRRIECHGSLPK